MSEPGQKQRPDWNLSTAAAKPGEVKKYMRRPEI